VLSQARLFHCMHKLLLMNRQRITPPSMLVRSCFGATARRGRPARRSPVALSSGVCAAVLASMSGELGGCSGGRTGAAERGAAPPPAPGGAQAHAAVDARLRQATGPGWHQLRPRAAKLTNCPDGTSGAEQRRTCAHGRHAVSAGASHRARQRRRRANRWPGCERGGAPGASPPARCARTARRRSAARGRAARRGRTRLS